MAVYIRLTDKQIGDLLSNYDLGVLHSYRGTEDGIETPPIF
ncbi:MAG: hypothetical protein QGF90_08760 [Gammaproteobacteria bacterium]|nr:hypothetical protein [Gammaproteobacteria bacterium]